VKLSKQASKSSLPNQNCFSLGMTHKTPKEKQSNHLSLSIRLPKHASSQNWYEERARNSYRDQTLDFEASENRKQM
jgi:hypothetical protein